MDHLIDDSYVARGLGLITSTVGCKTEFYLYSKYDNNYENISVEIKGRKGERGSTKISDRNSTLANDDQKSIPVGYVCDQDSIKVTYTPLTEGVHTLTLSKNHVPICRSPYYISVEKNPTNTRSKIRLGTKKYKMLTEFGKGKHSTVEIQADSVSAMNSSKPTVSSDVHPASSEKEMHERTDVMSMVTKFESRSTATKTRHQRRMSSISEIGPEIDQHSPDSVQQYAETINKNNDSDENCLDKIDCKKTIDDDGGRKTKRIDKLGENFETTVDKVETEDLSPTHRKPVSPVLCDGLNEENMLNAENQDPIFKIKKQLATQKNDHEMSERFFIDQFKIDGSKNEPSIQNEKTNVDAVNGKNSIVTKNMIVPESFSKEVHFAQQNSDLTEYNISKHLASILTKITNSVCGKCSKHVFNILSQLPRDLHIIHSTNSSEIRPSYETLLAQPNKININMDNVNGDINKNDTNKSAYLQFINPANVDHDETNNEILKCHSLDVNEFFDHNSEELCSQVNKISSISIAERSKYDSEVNEISGEKITDTTLISSTKHEVEIDQPVLSNGILSEKGSINEKCGISINSDAFTNNTDYNSENKITQGNNFNLIESCHCDENIVKTSNNFVGCIDLTLNRSNSLMNYNTENISYIQNEDKSKSIENLAISNENDQCCILNDSVLASIKETLANAESKDLYNDQQTTNICETNDQISVLTTALDVDQKLMIEKSIEPILKSFKKNIVENFLQYYQNKDSLKMNYFQTSFSGSRNTKQINESLETKLHNHTDSIEFLNTEDKNKQVENNEMLLTQINSGINKNNISESMTAQNCPDHNKLNKYIENIFKHITIPNENHLDLAIETKFQKIVNNAMHQPYGQQQNSFNSDVHNEKISKTQSDVFETLILNSNTGILPNDPEGISQQKIRNDQTTTNSTWPLIQSYCDAVKMTKSNSEKSNAEHKLPMSNNNETNMVHRSTELCITFDDSALSLCDTVTEEELIKTETILPNTDKYDDPTTTTTDLKPIPQNNVLNVSTVMSINKTNPAEMENTNEVITPKDVKIDVLEQLDVVDTKITLESKDIENYEINVPNIVGNEIINSNIIGINVMNEPPVLSNIDINTIKLTKSNEFETAVEDTIKNDIECIETERKNSVEIDNLSETKKLNYSKSMLSNRETRFKLPLLNVNEIVIIERLNLLRDLKISIDTLVSNCTAVVTIEIGAAPDVTNANLAIEEPNTKEIKNKTNIPTLNTSESVMVKESNVTDIDMLTISEEPYDIKRETLINKTMPEITPVKELKKIEIGTIHKIPASNNMTDTSVNESKDTEPETLNISLKLNDAIAKPEKEAKEIPQNIGLNNILNKIINESVEKDTDTIFEISGSNITQPKLVEKRNELEIETNLFLAPKLDNQPVRPELNDKNIGFIPQNTLSSDLISKEAIHESYKTDTSTKKFVSNDTQTKVVEQSDKVISETIVSINPKSYDKTGKREESDLNADIISQNSISSTAQAEIINESFKEDTDTTPKIFASNIIQSKLVEELKYVKRETAVFLAPKPYDQPVKLEVNDKNIEFISINTISNNIQDELNNESTTFEKLASNNIYEKLVGEPKEAVVEIVVCITPESKDEITKLKSKDIDTEIILQNTILNNTPTESITEVFATDINTSSENLESNDVQNDLALEQEEVKTKNAINLTPKSTDVIELKEEAKKTEIETEFSIIKSNNSNNSKPIEESEHMDTVIVLKHSILPNIPAETTNDIILNSKIDIASKTLEHNLVNDKPIQTSKKEILDIIHKNPASNEIQAVLREKLIERVSQTFPDISSNVNFEKITDQIEIIAENLVLNETHILPVEESKEVNMDTILANKISAYKYTAPLEVPNEINRNSTSVTLNSTITTTLEETMVETNFMTSETQNNIKSTTKPADKSKEIYVAELFNETLTVLTNNEPTGEELNTTSQIITFLQTKPTASDQNYVFMELLTRSKINNSKTSAIKKPEETGMENVISNSPYEISMVVPSTIESKTSSSEDTMKVKNDMMSITQTISDTSDEPETISIEREITTLIKHLNLNEILVVPIKNLEKVEIDFKYETLNTKDTYSNVIAETPEISTATVAKILLNDNCTTIFEKPNIDEIKIVTNPPKSNDANNLLFKESNNVKNYIMSLKPKDTQTDMTNETSKEAKIKEITHTKNELSNTTDILIVKEPILNDNKTTSTEGHSTVKQENITTTLITNKIDSVMVNKIKNSHTGTMFMTPITNENYKESNRILLDNKSDVPTTNYSQVVPKSLLNNIDNTVDEEVSVCETKTEVMILNSQSVTVNDSKNIGIENVSVLLETNITHDRPTEEPKNLDKVMLTNTPTFDDISAALITKLNQTEISTKEPKEISVGMLFAKPIYIEYPSELRKELEPIKIEKTSELSISTGTLPSPSEELIRKEIDISSKTLKQDADDITSKELNTPEIEIYVPNSSQNVSAEVSNEMKKEPVILTTNNNNSATIADELKEIDLYTSNENVPNFNTITMTELRMMETEIKTEITTIDYTIYAEEPKEIDVGELFAKPIYEYTQSPTAMMIRDLDQEEEKIISKMLVLNESLPPLLDKLKELEIDTPPGTLQENTGNDTSKEHNTLERVITISNDSQNVSVEYSNEMKIRPISVTSTTNNNPSTQIEKLKESEINSSNETILNLTNNIPMIESSTVETEITAKIPKLDNTQAISLLEQKKIETGMAFTKPKFIESSTIIIREPESIDTEISSKTSVSNGSLLSLLDELKKVKMDTKIVQENVRNITSKEPYMMIKENTTQVPGYTQEISIEEPKELEIGMLFAKSTYNKCPVVSIKKSKNVEIESTTDTQVLTDTLLLPIKELDKVEECAVLETFQENSTPKKLNKLENVLKSEISISNDSQHLSKEDSKKIERESTSHTTNVNVLSTQNEPHTMVETENANKVSKMIGIQNLSFEKSKEIKTEPFSAIMLSNDNAFAPTDEPKGIKLENNHHSLLNIMANNNMQLPNSIETKFSSEISISNTTEATFTEESKTENALSCTNKLNSAKCNTTELSDELNVTKIETVSSNITKTNTSESLVEKIDSSLVTQQQNDANNQIEQIKTMSDKTLPFSSFEPIDEQDLLNNYDDTRILTEVENLADESKLLFKSSCESMLESGEENISKEININFESKKIKNQNETEINNQLPDKKEIIPEPQQPNFTKTPVTNYILDLSESTPKASDISNFEKRSLETLIAVNIKSEPKPIEEPQHMKQDNTYDTRIISATKTTILESTKTFDETIIGDTEKKNIIVSNVNKKSLDNDQNTDNRHESFEKLIKKTFETHTSHDVETKLYCKLNDLITATLKEEISNVENRNKFSQTSSINDQIETENSDVPEEFSEYTETSNKDHFNADNNSQEKPFGIQKLELSVQCTKASDDDHFEKTYVQLEQTEKTSPGEIFPLGTEGENITTTDDNAYPVNESDMNAILCASSLQEALTLLDSKIKIKLKNNTKKSSSRTNSAIYKTSVQTSTSSSSDNNTNFTEAREFFKKIEQKTKK